MLPGTHRFALEVKGPGLNGQSATSSQEFDLKVVTAETAVRTIVGHVSASSLRINTKRQLAHSLTSARENFDRGRFSNGVRHLRGFETQVRAHVRRLNATLAAELRNAAREIRSCCFRSRASSGKRK